MYTNNKRNYQQFINIRLTIDKSSTADGDLFKQYYKQVFVKIDCGGQTKYFSKTRINSSFVIFFNIAFNF